MVTRPAYAPRPARHSVNSEQPHSGWSTGGSTSPRYGHWDTASKRMCKLSGGELVVFACRGGQVGDDNRPESLPEYTDEALSPRGRFRHSPGSSRISLADGYHTGRVSPRKDRSDAEEKRRARVSRQANKPGVSNPIPERRAEWGLYINACEHIRTKVTGEVVPELTVENRIQERRSAQIRVGREDDGQQRRRGWSVLEHGRLKNPVI